MSTYLFFGAPGTRKARVPSRSVVSCRSMDSFVDCVCLFIREILSFNVFIIMWINCYRIDAWNSSLSAFPNSRLKRGLFVCLQNAQPTRNSPTSDR